MSRTPRIVLAALAVALVVVTPAATAPVAPVLASPDDGATVNTLPPFKWNAVADAATYEFELSADPGFNSSEALVTTKNTRAALKTLVANGTYYWRVRGVTSTGSLGAWSEVRTLEMAWTAQPALLTPSHGATITYPNEALELTWNVVPGASKYLVKVATDPALGSLVWSEPVETAATAFTLSDPLAPGTYYWGITPVDADGHNGNPSTVASFTWAWPSTTDTSVSDLVSSPEVYDPQFSWDPVPGAAGYEVEVNFSSDWATSSKVCCDPISFFSDASTLGTSLSPLVVLNNNTYYWRVRAIDASDNAGVWNVGPPFTKTFDNVPPVSAPSVKNLRMRDNVADPATDTDTGTTVVDTDAPVVAWDAVPGASGYQVNVTNYSGGACDWSTIRWNKEVAVTAWTPLGWSMVSGGGPYPPWDPSSDFVTSMVAGQEYCVRVRAVDRPSEPSGPTVFGDYTYLPANNQAAFRWNGPPASTSCSPCSMGSSDYGAPLTGTSVGSMPLFTWDALPGAESYYVLVSRDANFTNIIDFAYTRIPAYAPREASASIGYADETTLYYWAVLPADNLNGSGVSAEPLTSGPQSFTKQSAPPVLVAPIDDAIVNTPATVFQWEGTVGARRYRVQVAQDPTFSNPIDDIVTDSTAYTSNTTYPSDTALYWRVRADAENGQGNVVGLTWSASGTFRKQLPKPVLDPDNPTSGSFLPTVKWSTVPGAISYDFHLVEPDGDVRDFPNIPAPAAAFTKLTGVGIATWQIRANFPTDSSNVVHGPYSLSGTYAHTIPEPTNPGEEAGASRLLLTWDPRPRADDYRVQVSTRADFATTVDNTTTQTTGFAPLLTSGVYTAGGTFYWRVAMRDADSNLGDYTGVRSFTLPPITTPGGGGGPTVQKFKVMSTGYPVRRKIKTVTLTVRNSSFQPVQGASVRVSGAGVTVATKPTNADGKVIFRIRATKYPGKVTFRVTKTGFTTLYHIKTVRPV